MAERLFSFPPIHRDTRTNFLIFSYDAANASTYPAQDWVQQSKGGLVAVQVQYRLGPFGEPSLHVHDGSMLTCAGFLSSEAIEEDGDLNAGLCAYGLPCRCLAEH